jgi:hypothetical protein
MRRPKASRRGTRAVSLATTSLGRLCSALFVGHSHVGERTGGCYTDVNRPPSWELRTLGEMRTAELLAVLRGVVAWLALVGRRLALSRVRAGSKKSRRRIAARPMVVGRLLVDENRGDRVTGSKPLSARGACPGIFRRHCRLVPDVTKVVVTTSCAVDVHLRHPVKSCSSRSNDIQRWGSAVWIGEMSTESDKVPCSRADSAERMEASTNRERRFRCNLLLNDDSGCETSCSAVTS